MGGLSKGKGCLISPPLSPLTGLFGSVFYTRRGLCWFSVCWFSVWPVVSNSLSVGKVTRVLIQGQFSPIVSCHIFGIHVCLFSTVASREGFFAIM